VTALWRGLGLRQMKLLQSLELIASALFCVGFYLGWREGL
jgi:hypothetical protein